MDDEAQFSKDVDFVWVVDWLCQLWSKEPSDKVGTDHAVISNQSERGRAMHFLGFEWQRNCF